MERMRDFFRENRKVAVAFSGGVDSSFLLAYAKDSGCDVSAYIVDTAFQPRRSIRNAIELAHSIDVDPSIIKIDIASDQSIMDNPPDRCYLCKKKMFSALIEKAHEDGYDVVLDGTNATDRMEDRPGMKVLQELGVLSPLRKYGYGKDDIRRLSKELGLSTWDMPSYSCLATRAVGCRLTKEDLERTEASEEFLMSLGIKDIRVRYTGDDATVQVGERYVNDITDQWEKVEKVLSGWYNNVVLDPETR